MAHSTSIRAVDHFAVSGADRSRVCSLAFRPSRFFACRIEDVLADFFLCDDLELVGMSQVAWELLHSTVVAKLDERVTVDAAFSPAHATGCVHVCLYYRLPTTELGSTERTLQLLDRSSRASGYYRFGRGAALPLRAHCRVRSSVVGFQAGESLMVTSLLLSLEAVQPDTPPGRP